MHAQRAAAGGLALILAAGLLHAQSAPAQPPQKPPVFRAEAHYVRVDAYPTKDGRIVEGLTKEDFDVLEDGKPQAIDALEYIDFAAAVQPEAARRDPNSQRDGFDLAADPRYRIFVLYLDAYHIPLTGSHAVRRPIVDLLNRMLGAQDLFGVLTPAQEPMRDLLLGQQTRSIEEQLAKYWTWGRAGTVEREPEEVMIEACFVEDPRLAQALVHRWRIDRVFSNLEETIMVLGGLREERKNLILFSTGWRLPGRLDTAPSRPQGPPGIGVTDAGKLTTGRLRRGAADPRVCADELNRLSGIDFAQRHRDMIRLAQQANVTIYPVNPVGLEAPGAQGMDLSASLDDINSRTDRLQELAANTDGVAVINTNDLRAGMQKITNDLAAQYVLGYYTTNTNWNGLPRRITVRLRATGQQIRARREYRAPTEAEMATLRNPPAASRAPTPSPVDEALGTLSRLRPSAVVNTYGRAAGTVVSIVTELQAARVEAGQWKNGGDLQVMLTGASGEIAGTAVAKLAPGARAAIVHLKAESAGPWHAVVRLRGDGESPEEDQFAIPLPRAGLLGDPLVYRAASAAASPLRPVASFQFRRTERVAIEWPLLAPLDSREARLLGRDGQPLALAVSVVERESGGAQVLATELNLAPLTAGDYVIEVTAAAAGSTERRLLALRVVR